MHAALWQLLWFDFRGALRGLLSLRKNWRQLGLLLLMLLFVGMFLSARTFGEGAELSSRFGTAMPFWALVYLLATWLTASADRGLVMRPAEIHFIVGGPFRDRDVVTLNLIRLAFRALISALVLSLIALAYVKSYLSALVGVWLLIAVSLLVGMLVSLSARRSGAAWIKRARQVGSAVALLLLVWLVAQAMQGVRASGATPQVSLVAAAAMDTPLGKILLPPLAWMFAPLSSPRFLPTTLLMLPPRFLVLGFLVAAIYFLASQFAEASTARTELSIAKRQTAMRSGVAGGAASSSWTRSVRLPMLPALGGVGAVAWMQILHSVRILPRYLVFTAAIVGVVLVIPLIVDSSRLTGWSVAGWLGGLTAYADFLLLLQLPVGFLGPVAQREMLKSLPLPAWRIAVGQLAGPLVPLAVLHVLLMALFLYLAPNSRLLILQTSLVLIPAGLVLVANINLLGAWNIIRPKALQQRDALAAGRAMASVWVFMVMLLPAVIIASLAAGVAAAWLGSQPGNYLLGAGLGLGLSSAIYIALLAHSFDRWQPNSAEGGNEETELDR